MSEIDVMQLYVVSGVWKSSCKREWRFILDEEKGARLITLESTTTLEELKMMILEDYNLEQSKNVVEVTYLPACFSGNSRCIPIVVSNDRQVESLVVCLRKEPAMQLCVTFKKSCANRIRVVKIDLNTEAEDASEAKNNDLLSVYDDSDNHDDSSEGFGNEAKRNEDAHTTEVGINDDFKTESGVCIRNKNFRVIEGVEVSQLFDSKADLKRTLEKIAMKYNFNYRVGKSDTKTWVIRCIDHLCNWRIRAVCLDGSTSFRVNKYVAEHTCAPSRKTNISKSASLKYDFFFSC